MIDLNVDYGWAILNRTGKLAKIIREEKDDGYGVTVVGAVPVLTNVNVIKTLYKDMEYNGYTMFDPTNYWHGVLEDYTLPNLEQIEMSRENVIHDLLEFLMKRSRLCLSTTLMASDYKNKDEILDNVNSMTTDSPVLLRDGNLYHIKRKARNFKFYEITNGCDVVNGAEKKFNLFYEGSLCGELADIFKAAYIGQGKRLSIIRNPIHQFDSGNIYESLNQYNNSMQRVDEYLEKYFR